MSIEGSAEAVTVPIPLQAQEPRLQAQEPRTERLQTATPITPDELVPTELRIHGVTGTPAESMLDRHIVGQVAGDREAGFFRPRPEYGATLGPGGARLEAYRWGNLTAGAAARAFWLLLLPFTFANVAIWMRPPAVRMARRIIHGLCRIFALTMSATLTLAAVGVTMDLVAWQCAAPGSRCIEQRPWLRWLFTGFFEPTGRRLALAALGPIALVLGLWFLARRTWIRYESFKLDSPGSDGEQLATPTFWYGRAQVARLRGVHIATMFAVIDLVLLAVLLRHDLSTDAYHGVRLGPVTASTVVTIGRVLAAVAAALLVAGPLLLLLPPVVDRVSASRPAGAFIRILVWVSLLVTGGTLAYAMVPRAPWTTSGPLPWYADAVVILFAGQVGLLGVLTLVVATQRHRCRGAFLGGFGTPVVASLSLGIGAALSAGVSYRVADYLDGSAVPSPAHFDADPAAMGLQPPLSYQWAAFGFVLLVLVLIFTALWLRLVTMPVLRRRARPDTDDDYPGGRALDPQRAASLDRAIANACLTDHVSRILGAAWIILAGVGIAATVAALAGVGPVQLARSGSSAARVLSIVTNAGTYLISLFVLGIVVLSVQTYRNARVRRTVGVLWDLGTFWPRSAHPLAPPCYAERAVPELVHRATWLATTQGGVILSGHSQGSVLAAATVLQLPEHARRRTALLTYGSPLARLYQRAFPNYVNEKVIYEIGAALADERGQERWINLWRRTDPIGGPVGIGDRRLADPVSFGPLPGDRVPPAVLAHSGYQVTPPFAQAVADLIGLLSVSARQDDRPATGVR